MGRTPNDERSDTMNPNNAAYHADHENRGGPLLDDHLDSSPVVAPKPEPAHSLRDVLDSDLGPRDGYAKVDLTALRWKVEDLLATPESKERDRKAALVELFGIVKRIFSVVHRAAERQGVGAEFLVDARSVEVVLHDGRSIRVEALEVLGFVRVVTATEQLYGYEDRGWHEAEVRKRPPQTVADYQIDKPRFQGRRYEAKIADYLVSEIEQGRFTPSIAALRRRIVELTEQVTYDRERSESRWYELKHPISELQAAISRVMARVPEPVRSTSWEDSWCFEDDPSPRSS